jgi:hypothetical protein
MNELIKFLKCPWIWYRNRKALKARLTELRKRDPFIYK